MNSSGLLLCFGLIFSTAVTTSNGQPIPQTLQSDEVSHSVSESERQNRDSPVMVPVSSTVIPVSSIFGNPKPEATGTGELFPYFPTFAYSRRSRFFEKSSKPDTPVRLITKNSKLKAPSDGY